MTAELLIRIVELEKVSMQNEDNRQTEKARLQQEWKQCYICDDGAYNEPVLEKATR